MSKIMPRYPSPKLVILEENLKNLKNLERFCRFLAGMMKCLPNTQKLPTDFGHPK